MYKLAVATILVLSFCDSAYAQMRISVLDKDNHPLSNVVVELTPSTPLPVSPAPIELVVMKQLDQQFVPHILAVEKGSVVAFPDTDTVKHHVYSFSQAKTFEVRVYKEEVNRRITFDKSGVAAIGCNIHDWMLGYIYVANSSLFALSDENGEVVFSDLVQGGYSASLWHPRIDEKDTQHINKITYSPNNNGEQKISLSLLQPLLPSLNEFDDLDSLQNYD
jgi:plastocyanin